MSYIYSPFLYDETTDRKEVLDMSNKSSMSDSERDRVIRALEDVAKRNNGEPTRADAVAVLAGKKPAQKPLRPGVKGLLSGGR